MLTFIVSALFVVALSVLILAWRDARKCSGRSIYM